MTTIKQFIDCKDVVDLGKGWYSYTLHWDEIDKNNYVHTRYSGKDNNMTNLKVTISDMKNTEQTFTVLGPAYKVGDKVKVKDQQWDFKGTIVEVESKIRFYQ